MPLHLLIKSLFHSDSYNLKCCLLLTLSGVTQLSTHYGSISTIPGCITHSTPTIVHTDLHPPFVFNITSSQSQLTSYTRSCDIKVSNNNLQVITNFLGTETLPSQPTPASSEWRQLCDNIGRLEHSKILLEPEVHWTSSRRIGPLPTPK